MIPTAPFSATAVPRDLNLKIILKTTWQCMWKKSIGFVAHLVTNLQSIFIVFRAHLKRRHEEAQIIFCTETGCKYSSYNPLDILPHINKWHHRNRLFKCEGCSNRFNCKGKDHLRVHRSRCPAALQDSNRPLAARSEPIVRHARDAANFCGKYLQLMKPWLNISGCSDCQLCLCQGWMSCSCRCILRQMNE